MKNIDRLKTDMMELWKETFHDSMRYIRLVFDTYFTPDNAFAKYHENRIIAALLSIPYEFQILTKGGKKTRLKGKYLCGLATRPEFRRRGIMAQLMSEAENSAAERGYDMTFLIPADSDLREYYRKKGYSDVSYTTTVAGSDLKKSSDFQLYIYTIRELFEAGRWEWVKLIADWCRSRELESQTPTILHSHQDMIAIMAENENSIFLTKNAIDLKYPNLTRIAAVAFPDIPERGSGPVKIVGLFKKDETDSQTRMRTMVEHHFLKSIENSLSHYYANRRVDFKLPCAKSEVDIMGGVEAYAMMKSIGSGSSSLIIENLPLKIYLMLD